MKLGYGPLSIIVTPAKAGVQGQWLKAEFCALDARLRGHDEGLRFLSVALYRFPKDAQVRRDT